MAKKNILTEDLVYMYREQHLTLREIGLLVGLSHTGVSKRLKGAGVLDSRVVRHCGTCGGEVEVNRSRAKGGGSFYCGKGCYGLSRSNPEYVPWRQGSRLARMIVSQYFELGEGNVVHHKDSNQRNNRVENLMVFASHSDHMKHHHGRGVKPLWDGENP